MTEGASVLRVPASFTGLEEITRFVVDLARRALLPEQVGYRLRLAVDELATNTVTYGYRAEVGTITVSGAVEHDRVWVRLEDQAPLFDPRTRMRPPDPTVPPEARPIGGLGIYLALSSLDEFSYTGDTGRNVSILTVHRG